MSLKSVLLAAGSVYYLKLLCNALIVFLAEGYMLVKGLEEIEDLYSVFQSKKVGLASYRAPRQTLICRYRTVWITLRSLLSPL